MLISEKNKFGVSTLLFREFLLEKALGKIKRTGFSVVDLSIVPPKFCPHYLPLETNKLDDAKLKELLKFYRLKISSLNIFPGYYNRDDPKKVTFFIERCIEIASLLKTQVITIPSGTKVHGDKWLESVHVVKKNLKEISKRATDKNVVISVETPHKGTLTETIDEAKRFHEFMDNPDIKCTLDTSHVLLGGKNSILDGIDAIGFDRINHVHLRDTIRNDITFTPGKGQGNFKDFFKFLKTNSYAGHLIFELEYHNLTERAKFEELQFAKEYCLSLWQGERLPIKIRVKSNRLYQFFERFKHNPKLEIKRYKKLFLFLKKFKPVVLKSLPEVVYHGKWHRKYRFKKDKVVRFKTKSIVVVKKPEKIYRIGVVGCGWAGTEMHGPGFQRLNNVEIIGGFDINRGKTVEFATRIGGRSFSSLEELVEEGKPDIVSICSPEWAHYQTTIYLLKNGIDVFCEKLLATRYSHAREMVETASKVKHVLAVNYNYRFMPGVKKIKEVIEQKALGELSFFNINAHAMSYAHAIDLLSYLGGKIMTVSGTFKNDNTIRVFGGTDWSLYDDDILYVPSVNASVTCEFENGALGIVNSSYFYNLHSFVLSIEAVFENGVITLNGINMFDTTGELSFISKRKIKKVDMSFKKGVYARGYEYTFFSSIESFMKKYSLGIEPETPGKQGLYNMKIEKAITESNIKKVKIKMN